MALAPSQTGSHAAHPGLGGNTGGVPPTGGGGEETTRQRLIEAGERLFAERGFAGTNMRELTAEAGSNLASVNYHFGSKQRLYEAVFERNLDQLRRQRIEAVSAAIESAGEAGDPEPVIRALAVSFLMPLREPERGMRLLRLFMNEMNDPHLPPRMFLEQMVEPMERVMAEALTRACPVLDGVSAVQCTHSIVGQLVHIANAWQVFAHAGEMDSPVFDLDWMIEHAVRFSAGGVRACAAARSRGGAATTEADR